MGNRQHLEWLLEGLESWNSRRSDEFFEPDFEDFSINRAFEERGLLDPFGRVVLNRYDLAKSNFRNADLQNVDFDSCNMFEADFTKANLNFARGRFAICTRAIFSDAKMYHSDFYKAKFTSANLEDVQISNGSFFNADFTNAKLDFAMIENSELIAADFTLASLGFVSLKNSELKIATFAGAFLDSTNFEGANLEGAKFLSIWNKLDNKAKAEANYKRPDLNSAIGLSWSQIFTTDGDRGVILPKGWEHPDHWEPAPWEFQLSKEAANSNPFPVPIGDSHTHLKKAIYEGPPHDVEKPADSVKLFGTRIVFEPLTQPPERIELEQLYQVFRDDVIDAQSKLNLGNISNTLNSRLVRMLKKLPLDYNEVQQIPFGTLLLGFHAQLDAEREMLLTDAPEKVGTLDALLLSGNLLVDRLPKWQEFLDETRDSKALLEALPSSEQEALFDEAVSAIKSDPDHFDPSIFKRLNDYLLDQSIYGYLAISNQISEIARLVLTEVSAYTKDVLSEARKQSVIPVAVALLAQLGTWVTKMAGLLPKEFNWIKHGLDVISKLFM